MSVNELELEQKLLADVRYAKKCWLGFIVQAIETEQHYTLTHLVPSHSGWKEFMAQHPQIQAPIAQIALRQLQELGWIKSESYDPANHQKKRLIVTESGQSWLKSILERSVEEDKAPLPAEETPKPWKDLEPFARVYAEAITGETVAPRKRV